MTEMQQMLVAIIYAPIAAFIAVSSMCFACKILDCDKWYAWIVVAACIGLHITLVLIVPYMLPGILQGL